MKRLLQFLTLFALLALLISAQSSMAGSKPRVVLLNPNSHKRIDCGRSSEGIYRCPIRGTSSGFSAGIYQLLLWIKPVRPAGDGWYLQRGSVNGIHTMSSDGKWEGVGQIGNLEYPPHEGDTIEIAITLVTSDEARKLLGADGVIVRGGPTGELYASASDVTVHLK